MSLTGSIFMLAFAMSAGLALFVRPIFGLYLYVAVFYLHPPSRWWGEALPEVRWSLVAAVVTLISLYIHRKSSAPQEPGTLLVASRWYETTIAKGLIAYTLWMWIQAPWVISDAHMSGVILFSKYVLLFYLIVKIIDNMDDLAGFCLAHVIGCAYLGWLIYLAPDGGRLEGVGGPGIDDANTLGMHLATGLFFAAFQMLSTTGWQRWVTVVSIPLILNGIIQTETRGAAVGILAGGLAAIILKPARYRKRFYFFAIMGVLAVLVVANESFIERMQTMRASVSETSEWDNSAKIRVEVAKAQLRMFAEHPLGVGHQGTAILSRDYLDEQLLAGDSGDRASHNTLLSILVDQGLVGILIFSMMALSIMRMLRQIKRVERVGLPGHFGFYLAMLGGSIVVIYAAGMFAQYLKAEIQIWVLALLAVLWQQVRLQLYREEENADKDQHQVARDLRAPLTNVHNAAEIRRARNVD